MRLEPNPTQPGLWENKDWSTGEPGVFAILIGVSAYPHLHDGTSSELADENYGLGQLAVSALTAYKLFEWLRDRYQYSTEIGSSCKLAQCWLLLSPSEEEKAVIDLAVIKHMLLPTFDNCRDAILRWYNSMKRVDNEPAQLSRAVFFFSGHGLEVSMEEQILLPMDYLKPVTGTLNMAINVMDMRPALKELAIKEQFFFLDACRNDVPGLREKSVQGSGVLVKGLAHLANPDCNQMVMYATATGLQTYGPRSVDKGISLFGQSLLWGLQGERNFDLDLTLSPLAIQWSPLHQFVKSTYNNLLAQYNSPLKQKVKVSGEYDDSYVVVTHIDPNTLIITAGPIYAEGNIHFSDTSSSAEIHSLSGLPERLSELPERDSMVINGETGSNDIIIGLGRLEHGNDRRTVASAFTFKKYALPDQRLWNPFTTVNENLSAHAFFGLETVTVLWEKARLFRLDSVWPDDDIFTHNQLLFKGLERTTDDTGYRVTFTILNPGLYWLQLKDSRSNYGCVLPYIVEGPRPLFQAEFIYRKEGPGYSLQIDNLAVNLSSSNDDTLKMAAEVWEQYEDYGVEKAAKQIDAHDLHGLVYGKGADPLSALVASIILLRLGRTDKLPKAWLDNLLNWFPFFADTPVLFAEYLDRTQPVKDTGEYNQRIVEGLDKMHKRGLPIIGEALGYALRQSSLLTTISDTKSLSQTLDTLKQARQCFLPGGLFTVFTGSEEALRNLRKNWRAIEDEAIGFG